MGKRKERRLAAKIGAGRRFKLDLFAQPSGELEGSSPKDEHGNDMDADHDPEIPNSPSSGQKPENPLSLLGQYSDDELDDVPNKGEGELCNKKEATESVNKELEEGEIGEKEPSYQKVDDQNLQHNFAPASASQVVDADDSLPTPITLDEKLLKVDGEKKDPAPLASDDQTFEDMNLSWKMVLHEESNKYYYWNIATGETSWEIPEGLVQETALTDVPESSRKDMLASASGDAYNTTAFGVGVNGYSAGHGVGYPNGVSEIKYEQVAPEGQSLEQSKGGDSQLLGSSLLAGALPSETPTLTNYILPEQYNSVGTSTLSGYAVHDHNVIGSEQSANLPLHLVKHCETLLESLKLLQGSGVDSSQHILLSRYVSEIEVRLSDIRALLPYGSSLLPFWIHTERQLNQLANFVNSGITKENIKISGSYNSSKEAHVQQKGTGDDAKADTASTKWSPEISSGITNDEDMLVGTLKSSPDRESNGGGSFNVAKTSIPGPIIHSRFDGEGGMKVHATDHREKSSSKLDPQAGDDVDMDMDMDIDMEVVAHPGGLPHPSNLLAQPTEPIIEEPLVPESELFIPPPPEEEWVPPPPPDDEGIPPPPPDEPPESFCPVPPPPEPEGVHAIYGQQYSMNYGEPNVNYFENASTIPPGSSFYEHADSSQIAALNLPVYFATNQQPIALPTPADTALYYGPVANILGSSSSQASVSFTDGDSHSSLSTTVSGTFLSQTSASVVSAPATVSAKQHASALSYSAAETAPVASDTLAAVSEVAAAVSKSQPKAPRMKKPKVSVGSSMRSNKKVSSLVDKWKAAKEELEEEEERHETPLEILERKRQREIEDWRAQQIASGEAKENANFQPLGGNWRERVKRRRAKKEAATETPSAPTTEGIKQPDLTTLAKDLPPGWQVFWDDSSKQTYYSNATTSETTWTRPTR